MSEFLWLYQLQLIKLCFKGPRCKFNLRTIWEGLVWYHEQFELLGRLLGVGHWNHPHWWFLSSQYEPLHLPSAYTYDHNRNGLRVLHSLSAVEHGPMLHSGFCFVKCIFPGGSHNTGRFHLNGHPMIGINHTCSLLLVPVDACTEEAQKSLPHTVNLEFFPGISIFREWKNPRHSDSVHRGDLRFHHRCLRYFCHRHNL